MSNISPRADGRSRRDFDDDPGFAASCGFLLPLVLAGCTVSPQSSVLSPQSSVLSPPKVA